MTTQEATTEKRRFWEILVPTTMDGKPVRKSHHREWDKRVREISGGLTILSPAIGQWINPTDQLLEERMLPCRLIATDSQMDDIAEFTLRHYNQHSVMYYVISDHFVIKAANHVASSPTNQS